MHCGRMLLYASHRRRPDLPMGTVMKIQLTLIVAAFVLVFSVAASAQTQTQATSYCTQGNATSASCTFSALPSSGDFVLIQGQRWATAGTITSCSDNQNNTYSVIQTPLATVISAFICFATNIGTPSGTFTVTVTSGDASGWNFKATSWSGMATASVLDVTAMGAGGFGTQPSSGATGTLAQTNNLVAASVGISTTQTSIVVESVSPAWTEQFQELDQNITLAGEADTRVISSSSAQTANWTLSTDAVWSALIAVFKGGSSCPGGALSDGSVSDTQLKINQSSDGGVVCLPPGPLSWNSTVTIPSDRGITLRGAGIDSTIITVGSTPGNRRAIEIAVAPGNSLTRVTALTIDHGLVSCGAFCSPISVRGNGIDRFRIDNTKLTGVYDAGIFFAGETLGYEYSNGAQLSGLVDNNIIECHPTLDTSCHPLSFYASPPWFGDLASSLTAGWGAPFARAVEFGSDKSIYVEDNTFNLNYLDQDGLTDSFGGAQVVFRFNRAYGSAPGNHGLDTAAYRASRWFEVYGNQFFLGEDNPACGVFRGGLLLYFDNVCDHPSSTKALAFQIQRARPQTFEEDIGQCDGSSAFDGNVGSGTNTRVNYPSIGTGQFPGWPCIDQIGWHFDDDGGAGYSWFPAYVFNNSDGAGGQVVVSNYESDTGNLQNYLKCNRDYFVGNDFFTGSATVGDCSTGGVGRGTLAQRPDMCTAGVAYWATDAGGNWNAKNKIADDGALYACTSTDTWTLYYKPYPYPHPLAN